MHIRLIKKNEGEGFHIAINLKNSDQQQKAKKNRQLIQVKGLFLGKLDFEINEIFTYRSEEKE